MKICLLGATGFIGRSIAKQLENSRIDWIGVNRTRSSSTNLKTIAVENTAELIDIIADYPVVINTLGSFKPKDFMVNFEDTFTEFWQILQAVELLILNSAIEKYVHISSAGTVYGEAANAPNEETDFLRPKSWYGRSKVIEERILSNACREKGVGYLCARVTNPFGNSGITKHGIIDVLINCIKKNKSFSVGFNQNAMRDFIYCDDMARMILKLIYSDQEGIFNVGSGRSLYLQDIIDLAQEICPAAKIVHDTIYSDTDVEKSIISLAKYHSQISSENLITVQVLDYLKTQLSNCCDKA